MFHLLANTIAIGQTVDTDVTPVVDSVFLIQNSHFVPQTDVYLLAALAESATLNRTRLITPSLRVVSTPWIRPIQASTLAPNTLRMADYRNTPLRLRALEEIEVAATSGLAMGTERFTSGLWVGDGVTPIPSGDVITMRGTSTTTATANAWTQLTTTWQDTLPNGVYTIVGLVHQSTNGQLCRLVINGQYWRPGVVSVSALGNNSDPMFLKGGMGAFGNFRSVAMPIVEVLCNGADASHEMYLEFVRISGTIVQ